MTDNPKDAERLARIRDTKTYWDNHKPSNEVWRDMIFLSQQIASRDATIADLERRLAEARAGVTKLCEVVDFAHGWIGGLPREPSFEDKRAAQAALEMAREAVTFDINIEDYLNSFEEATAPPPPVAEASGETLTAAEMNRQVFSNWLQRRRSILAGETPQPTADHTELVEPLTGNTKIIDRNTGRIVGTCYADDHTERAREVIDDWRHYQGQGNWDLPYLRETIATALAESRAETARQFTEAIVHGDDEHRAWLREAAEAFIAGAPMPPPR